MLFVVKHTKTQEDLVVCQALYDSLGMITKLWVRPRSMFLEKVESQGLAILRLSGVD